MNQKFQSIKKTPGLLIFLFPLFYFFAGVYFRFILEDTSLRSVDPDYVYYMTGLNISEGIFKLVHIDHPGTPLQYLVAIIFKITWLFRQNPAGYVADVMANPDLYLSIVNLSITLIMLFSLYFAGKYVLEKTGSVLYAMLVQTIPMISVLLYEIIGRIMPELLLPLPILWLTAFLIGWVSSGKDQFTYSDLIVLGLIMAFGLSIKLTLIPLCVVPLIIVRGWKAKLLVTIVAAVAFLIFAFPVTLQIERFWHWGRDLFLHSGQYGNGEKNIINLPDFLHNLGQMIRLQKHFTIIVVLMVFTVTVLFVLPKKKLSGLIRIKRKITIAVLFAIFAQVIMSGKHYESRYFMPALMFAPILIFLFIEIVKELYPSKYLNAGLSSLLVIFLGWILWQQVSVIRYTSEAVEKQMEARNETRSKAANFEKGSIKIIVSQDYGCPFIEYALQFGLNWAPHDRHPQYIEQLAKLYPDTYQYTTWDGQFRYWAKPFDAQKIIDEKIPVYLYLEKNSEELYSRTIQKLRECGKEFAVEKKLFFENSVNGECIFQLFLLNPITEVETSTQNHT